MDYRDPDWVAEKLGIDRNTVYKFLQDGTLPAVQLGRKWLISEAQLERWLAEETERQTKARREATRSTEHTVHRLDNYTAQARAALRQAHSEARRYAHDQLDQVHLLLGLIADPATPSARAMADLSIGDDQIRRHIDAHLTPGTTPPPRRLSRTPDAKKAMRIATRLAVRESVGQPLTLIGTDHLLMGILLSRRGLGYEFLVRRNVTRQKLRDALHASRPASPTNGERS